MIERILNLHPTQIAIGFQQVLEKRKKLEKLDDKKLDEYLESHHVPVVKHNNKLYIIDHHHLCNALDDMHIHKVYINIIEDYSELHKDDFWNMMKNKNYIWLFDEHGVKINLEKFLEILPRNIKEMKNDPYRSLAGILKNLGIYKKDWTPYSEFVYANLFREHIVLLDDDKFSDQIIYKATQLISQMLNDRH